jgi:hypothetical protein
MVNDSLHFQVEGHSADVVEISVRFDAVIMEGAGCVADRCEHFARLRQTIGQGGEILSAAAL